MTKEILLCKYGEIVLKGANRKSFEDMLSREMKKRAACYGNFDVYRAQSTIYIEPMDDSADMDGMFEAASKVFGIVAISRAAVCEKSMEDISRTAADYIPAFLEGKRTFKVEAKRSDKAFPLDSMEISREIGGVILDTCPRIRVDVHHPDVIVKVEIREFGAYISAGQFKGAGGMPVGSNGKGLLLLSGGIDSPVAGWMMAKRGVRLDAIHFESFPYTSERARDKVLELARIVAEYAGDIYVHVVSLTHIQEELVRACEEDYFTLLLRRYMMTIAERVAKEKNCAALITGESLGQVASQTMQALGVTDAAVSMPVFRPCIGMDKEEIVTISRKIGAFETSIQPYEDCCTVFTPKHPRTKPELAKVLVQENKLDFAALVEEAMGTLYTVHIKAEY
ncbi:MAG: tRNA 4-thiouridine(8) synthase ThiI [Ruminococcaceae bacterium]|nr:tRNA 4-thiouridine(8) synthase ThiI [Oscillospiraceae bacterium]